LPSPDTDATRTSYVEAEVVEVDVELDPVVEVVGADVADVDVADARVVVVALLEDDAHPASMRIDIATTSRETLSRRLGLFDVTGKFEGTVGG
jgi:hypothetical protein